MTPYFNFNMGPVIYCILEKDFLLSLFSYCRQFTFYLQMKVSMGLALKVGTFFQILLFLGEALVEVGL